MLDGRLSALSPCLTSCPANSAERGGGVSPSVRQSPEPLLPHGAMDAVQDADDALDEANRKLEELMTGRCVQHSAPVAAAAAA